MTTELIRTTLSANLEGRDFVIGDLHGAYAAFEFALKNLNFDKKKDRMFSVGDLVDRGPDSVKCLKLIKKRWFHYVRGNHEQMMLDYVIHRGRSGDWWMGNGGQWYLQLDTDFEAENRAFVREASLLVEAAPLIITVDKKDGGVFHVMHAEILPKLGSSETVTDELIANAHKISTYSKITTMDGEAFIWGRRVFYGLYGTELNEGNINRIREADKLYKFTEHLQTSTIYSGHTIMTAPVRMGPCVNLDTKAYAIGRPGEHTAALTITEPSTNTFWKVWSDGVKMHFDRTEAVRVI
jgi:hypothetical protein